MNNKLVCSHLSASCCFAWLMCVKCGQKQCFCSVALWWFAWLHVLRAQRCWCYCCFLLLCMIFCTVLCTLIFLLCFHFDYLKTLGQGLSVSSLHVLPCLHHQWSVSALDKGVQFPSFSCCSSCCSILPKEGRRRIRQDTKSLWTRVSAPPGNVD